MIWNVWCGGKIWVCIFLDKLVIVRFVEMCMGFGKGFFEYWVVVVKLGKIFYEMGGVFENIVRKVILIVVLIMFIKI